MNWHERYLQQAKWTADLRAYLFEKTGLSRANRVLEIGCGTGAVLSTLQTSARLYGLDRDAAALKTGAQSIVYPPKNTPQVCFTRGDAHTLPYAIQSFDIVYCHFLLLWVNNPLRALKEMKRVTKSNGFVLAIAEPDYTNRTDQPDEFRALGKLQNESLKRQGANIGIGARLAELFQRADIKIIETGVIQGRESGPLSPEEWQSEWEVMKSDLVGFVPCWRISRLRKLDEDARKNGTRLLNVPTYFAWGQV